MIKDEKECEQNLNLSILECLIFQKIFSGQDSLHNQLIAKDLMAKIELKDVDKADVDLKVEENRMTFNEEKASNEFKNILLNQSEVNYLKDRILILDKEKKIDISMVNLCLKIKNLS